MLSWSRRGPDSPVWQIYEPVQEGRQVTLVIGRTLKSNSAGRKRLGLSCLGESAGSPKSRAVYCLLNSGITIRVSPVLAPVTLDGALTQSHHRPKVLSVVHLLLSPDISRVDAPVV